MTALNQPVEIQHTVEWFDGSCINEVMFCEDFLSTHPLKCINGSFYGVNGMICDVEIEKDIYDCIKPFLVKGISKKVKQITEVMKLEAHSEELPIQQDRLHVRNGTYYLDGGFTPEKQFCLNRLPVSYNTNAILPNRWLQFLSELLEEEDIPTLQEYMGYSLLPTTKGQKMMLIIGKGGEGKSRIGLVMRSLLGINMNSCSIQKIETSKFARADLENKLLMIDDDMKMEALPQTNYIKSIVTLEDKIDLERKSKQSVQGVLYVRFLCFGNGNLSSLYDRSYGFFRRQIVLTTKDKDENRKDDPFLIEKLRQETEGIFLWCLEGLKRLIENDYAFTISARARANLQEAMEDGNNVISFMQSQGYVRLEAGTIATTKSLYEAYQQWCVDNTEKPIGSKSFTGYLKQNEQKYGITYSTNIPADNGKNARGFKGIHTQIRTSRF